MYEYRHDSAKQRVFKFPSQPDVHEVKDGRGRRPAWAISMAVEVTRADNKLNQNQWQHPVLPVFSEQFNPNDSREDAIGYFMVNNSPEGETISEEQYHALYDKYNALARARQTGAGRRHWAVHLATPRRRRVGSPRPSELQVRRRSAGRHAWGGLL